ELEVALGPRARVLRPLPLVAVRQEEHDAAAALPLRLGARDELVDDDLRAVREVAELRLPEDELLRVGQAEAELEAEDGVLGEHAVQDEHVALLRTDAVQRRVDGARLDVVEDGVAMAERPPAAVLPAHADGDALDGERAERERFGAAPVHLAAGRDHLHSL